MMMMNPGLNDVDGGALGYDDGDVIQSLGLFQIMNCFCVPIGQEKVRV